MTTATETPTSVVLERRSMSGEVLGEVRLDAALFSVPVNVPLLHQVVTAQLAARRAGTQSTKTRAEVAGGSSKPYRQKGTGNARQGSIRAPHYAGGGVALGPKPRSYAQKTPKKMVQLALKCALSDRARSGELRLVDAWSFEAPKTKEALAALDALECEGRVLVVLGRDEEHAQRSFANLGHVATLPLDQLTAYDVLAADTVVFSDATLPGDNSEGPAKRAPRRQRAEAADEPAAGEPSAPSAAEEEAEGDEDASAAASTAAAAEEPEEAAVEPAEAATEEAEDGEAEETEGEEDEQ